jgi:hypothetical protein
MRLLLRFPVASVISASLTVFFLWSATRGFGKYDHGTAIGTATLIVVIWYTFFTYGLLHKADEVLIGVELKTDGPRRLISVTVSNRTHTRTIVPRIRVRMRRNNQSVWMHARETAQTGARFLMTPHQELTESFSVAPPAMKKDSVGADATELAEPREAMITVSVEWTLDSGERRKFGPLYYTLDVGTCNVERISYVSKARNRWRSLGRLGQPAS